MKKCGWVKRHLPAYIDSELTGRKALKVERHLAECEKCRHAHAEEKLLAKLIKSGLVKNDRGREAQLSWNIVRESLEKEAKTAHTLRGIATYMWEGLREAFLPKATRKMAEVGFWGRRALVPAAFVILVLILYHTFEGPRYAPESGRYPTIIRIHFGQEGTQKVEGYFTDSGQPFPNQPGERNNLSYGWRLKEKGV